MLTPWLEAFPATTRETMEEIDECMGYRLTEVIQSGPGRVLTATAQAQPAIMATSILIVRVLEREYGFRVGEQMDVTLGHSLGEFAALVAGGYLGFGDSLWLVRRRAEAMAKATRQAVTEHGGGEYGMVAVLTEPAYMGELVAAIERILGSGKKPEFPTSTLLSSSALMLTPPSPPSPLTPSPSPSPYVPFSHPAPVQIANINSRNQIVLSGSIERIERLLGQVRRFLGHDPRAVRLRSDSPFHCAIMRPAVAAMRQMLEHERPWAVRWFPAGRLPCVSNVTARPFGSRAELTELLARQCEETVRWWDSIRYLDQQLGVRRWVGIGPGKVGRNLVGKEVGMRGKDPVKGGGVWAITDPSEIEEVLRGLEETESLEE